MKIVNSYICKDGRVRVYCTDDNGRHHIRSYSRILMEEKLGRPLEPYEDVHHIDGNPLNNSINNLEIKLHGEHQREHSQKYFDEIKICPICNCMFIWTALQQRRFYSNQSRKISKNKSTPFNEPICSKQCVGIYSKREQSRRNS